MPPRWVNESGYCAYGNSDAENLIDYRESDTGTVVFITMVFWVMVMDVLFHYWLVVMTPLVIVIPVAVPIMVVPMPITVPAVIPAMLVTVPVWVSFFLVPSVMMSMGCILALIIALVIVVPFALFASVVICPSVAA